MSRPIRFVPERGSLVEITTRTTQGRLLLSPGPALNELVLGVLGRAQQRTNVRCCGVAVLSSHYHLLLWVEDAEQMAEFMEYANGNMAREVGDHIDWPGPFWDRRYQAIVVSEEECSQVERLRYILSQSCKENLVASPRQWPGVHMAKALLDGEPLKGRWYDRKKEHQAKCRKKQYDPHEFAEEVTLELSPLPCWADLPEEQYRARITALVEEIEQEAKAARERRGVEPLGVEAILRQDPHTRPENLKRSPAPLFHTASKKMREALRQAYGYFVAAFRDAADKLKAGDLLAAFPAGSFPPGRPFVREAASLPP